MKTIRNEKHRNELIERLQKLNGTETPAWGRMNVDQMMSHLVQACEMPFVSTVPDRSSLLSRILIKRLVLYLMPIPKEVKVSPELDQQAKGRKPTGFDSDRQRVVDEIAHLAQLPADHKCLAHPFFGNMSTKEWALLAYKHTDHHLRQFGV